MSIQIWLITMYLINNINLIIKKLHWNNIDYFNKNNKLMLLTKEYVKSHSICFKSLGINL